MGRTRPNATPTARRCCDSVTGLFAGLVDDVVDPPPASVPARARLAGLAPMLVTTAECDALAAQGRRFADLALADGVDVTVHDVEALLHGYLNTVGDSRGADDALSRHVDWLRSALPSV